jgi:hypothetical protein
MEITESLSRSIARTVNARKPAQAGGGLVTASPALPAGLGVEQRAERRLPPGAQRVDPEGAQQLPARMPRQVEQPVDLGDRHLQRAGGDLGDLVAGLDVALLEHAEVEAGAAVGDEQRRDARIVQADPDAVAGDAWLADLEQRGADPVAVADADLVVGQPLHREVLAELPEDEVASPEFLLPVAIGPELVHEDRSHLAAVPGAIALAVAVHVEPAHAARTGHRLLEDAGEHRPPSPRHVLRHADVDRQQRAHAHAGAQVTPAAAPPRLR